MCVGVAEWVGACVWVCACVLSCVCVRAYMCVCVCGVWVQLVAQCRYTRFPEGVVYDSTMVVERAILCYVNQHRQNEPPPVINGEWGVTEDDDKIDGVFVCVTAPEAARPTNRNYSHG